METIRIIKLQIAFVMVMIYDRKFKKWCNIYEKYSEKLGS